MRNLYTLSQFCYWKHCVKKSFLLQTEVVLVKLIINNQIITSSEAAVQRCSVKMVFLKNLTKFTGKHLYQGLFFNKENFNCNFKPATLLKKRLCHRWFSVNFAKFLRTRFFIEHLWLLLLKRRHHPTSVDVHTGIRYICF